MTDERVGTDGLRDALELAEDVHFQAWLVSHDSGMHWGCAAPHECNVQRLRKAFRALAEAQPVVPEPEERRYVLTVGGRTVVVETFVRDLRPGEEVPPVAELDLAVLDAYAERAARLTEEGTRP